MDLDRGPRLAADRDPLREPLEAAAQVGHVDPSVAGGHPGEPDEFLGAHEGVRDVGQAARQRERPLLHRLGDERLHALEFLLGRVAFLVPDHGGADLSRAHVGDDVRAHPGELQPVEIAPEGGPVALDGRRHHHRVVHRGSHHRPRREMLAEHLGGDALGGLAQGAGIDDQPVLRVGVHVDEPGGQHHPAGVDLPKGVRFFRPHAHDGVPGDGEVPPEPGAAGPVHDARAADQQVGGLRGIAGGRAARGQGHRHECRRSLRNASHLPASRGFRRAGQANSGGDRLERRLQPAPRRRRAAGRVSFAGMTRGLVRAG